MGYLKFVYNVSSGEKLFAGKYFNDFFTRAARRGYRVEVIPMQQEIMTVALKSFPSDTRAIIVAGGDGSLNWVINTLLKNNSKHTQPPLAVVPWGTSNDFARQLGTPFSVNKLLDAIENGQTVAVDMGCVNDKHFINVTGAGFLVDVAHKTSSSFKQALGMLAYYLEGARQLPAYRPFNLVLQNEGENKELEADLFLVLNGKEAGGIRNLAPRASLTDGKLDVVIFKKTGIPGLISLVPRLLMGQHVDDPRVIYFQSGKFRIDAPSWVETDLDGEPGPPLPLSFSVLPEKLSFITIK